ncbi:hypothetical protein BDY21DRAFT_405926 [Lineolata rhizophorae]|uniref:Uncharacterized protein n=1 Tax=Lineolata rhizophorae TaxID=578093 RepID=A0A6A6P974_9PEZI|nr:hypothetical protein BDY21DRAFT_405926 [Lineolata rhizophorae]
MPADSILSSNLVNYLVWRYLQEAGYGNAAVSLQRNWKRDPEALPFAKSVSAHTLVHIIQDGLWLDKLQSSVTKEERRYDFGSDHGDPYPVHDGQDGMDDVSLAARFPGSSLPTGAPAPGPPGNQPVGNGLAVPSSQPQRRRKRTSNGVDTRSANGDAMDVDAANGAMLSHATPRTETTEHPPETEDADQPETPPPIIEEVPLPSTLSIGITQGLQTDPVVELATPERTTIVKLEPDPLSELSIAWCPPPERNPFLLAAGENLMRLYDFHGPPRDGPDIPTTNVMLPFKTFSVTALSWHTPDDIIVAAAERRTNDAGEQLLTRKLLNIRSSGDVRVISSAVGDVTALRWNGASRLLLSISAGDAGGSIRLWAPHPGTPSASPSRPSEDNANQASSMAAATASTELLDTHFTSERVYEAVWMGGDTFAVSGERTLRIYEAVPTAPAGGRRIRQIRDFSTPLTWERLRYDASADILAASSLDDASNPDNEFTIIAPSDFLDKNSNTAAGAGLGATLAAGAEGSGDGPAATNPTPRDSNMPPIVTTTNTLASEANAAQSGKSPHPPPSSSSPQPQPQPHAHASLSPTSSSRPPGRNPWAAPPGARPTPLHARLLPGIGAVTDMAFQPHGRPSETPLSPSSSSAPAPASASSPTRPPVLATSSDDGAIYLWDARVSTSGAPGPGPALLRRLSMVPAIGSAVPALAMAWAPDGRAIAAAGRDSCAVWCLGKGRDGPKAGVNGDEAGTAGGGGGGGNGGARPGAAAPLRSSNEWTIWGRWRAHARASVTTAAPAAPAGAPPAKPLVAAAAPAQPPPRPPAQQWRGGARPAPGPANGVPKVEPVEEDDGVAEPEPDLDPDPDPDPDPDRMDVDGPEAAPAAAGGGRGRGQGLGEEAGRNGAGGDGGGGGGGAVAGGLDWVGDAGGADEVELDHGVVWDAGGERIAYRVGNRIAVIRIR